MSLRNPPVKLFYRIGEVADAVGVQTHVLRYWESEFGTIRPQKSSKGQRVYSHKDLEKLLRVKELLHSEGYTIAGAKRKLRQVPGSDELERMGIRRMRDQLAQIRDEIRVQLDVLASERES